MDMLFLAFLPLLLFVIIEFKWGIRAGIISASVLAVLLAVYTYFKLGAVDEFLMGEVVLILALGAFSLKMKNSRYFKLQPVVVGVIFSIVILWYQVFDEPILIKMLPTMYAFAPELEQLYANSAMQAKLGVLSFYLAITFILHSLLVAWTVYRKGNVAWILARAAIYPLTLLTAFLGML